jgi:hypothetical protein
MPHALLPPKCQLRPLIAWHCRTGDRRITSTRRRVERVATSGRSSGSIGRTEQSGTRPLSSRLRRRRGVTDWRRERAVPAPVAQGIEHRFPKPCVAGSNPAGGANVKSSSAIAMGRYTTYCAGRGAFRASERSSNRVGSKCSTMAGVRYRGAPTMRWSSRGEFVVHAKRLVSGRRRAADRRPSAGRTQSCVQRRPCGSRWPRRSRRRPRV